MTKITEYNSPLDVLSDAVKEALNTGHIIDCGPVSIDTNGWVVFYYVGDVEVTAAQALAELERTE